MLFFIFLYENINLIIIIIILEPFLRKIYLFFLILFYFCYKKGFRKQTLQIQKYFLYIYELFKKICWQIYILICWHFLINNIFEFINKLLTKNIVIPWKSKYLLFVNFIVWFIFLYKILFIVYFLLF